MDKWKMDNFSHEETLNVSSKGPSITRLNYVCNNNL